MNRRILVLPVIVAILSSFFAVVTPSTIATDASCSTRSGTGSSNSSNATLLAAIPVESGDTVTLTFTASYLVVGIINLFDTNNTIYAASFHEGYAGSVSAQASKSGTAKIYIGDPSTGQPFIYTYTISVCHSTLPFPDGRCNQEAWQSFAVYPDYKGGYVFYALYQGVGYYAMHVTEKMLDQNPDTGVNHVIAESEGVQLWRLQGGLLQAHRIGMDDKDYSFNLTCGMMEDGD